MSWDMSVLCGNAAKIGFMFPIFPHLISGPNLCVVLWDRRDAIRMNVTHMATNARASGI